MAPSPTKPQASSIFWVLLKASTNEWLPGKGPPSGAIHRAGNTLCTHHRMQPLGEWEMFKKKKNPTSTDWKKQSEEQDGILSSHCLLKGSLSLASPTVPGGLGTPPALTHQWLAVWTPWWAGCLRAGRGPAPRLPRAGSVCQVVNQPPGQTNQVPRWA